MIPSDYRLEQVVVGLIERLDSARLSFDSREEADAGFHRIVDKQLASVIDEWRGLEWNADPEAHAEFLRTEVHETFLPRFTRIATAQSASEADVYGLGWAASPIGRIVLIGATLIALRLMLRFIWLPEVWPLVLVSMALPVLPEIAAWFAARRYHRQVSEIVGDMARIQAQQLAYQPTPASTAEPAPAKAPRQRGQGQRETP